MVERHEHVVKVGEMGQFFPCRFVLHVREVVDAQDDVLGGRHDGTAARRGEQVVRREHEQPGFRLGFDGQGHVDGHLVAVEVGVEGGADHGVKAYGLALHEHGLEGLDAQPVERGGPVQHDRVVLDDLLEDAPDLFPAPLDDPLGALYVGGEAPLNELADDEGLEELEGHLLRQAALVDLELGADDDDGPAGIVHPLSEEVLPEAPLLAPEQVREALEGPVARPQDSLAHAAVVDEGVNGFLEHALLVADDDLRSLELLELFQPVVPVDDPAVQVVEVRRGEPAAVELHHGAQVGRYDRQHFKDHGLGGRFALPEILRNLESLDELPLLLAGALGDFLPEGRAELVEIDLLKQGLDSLGPYARPEFLVVGFAEIIFPLEDDVGGGEGGNALLDDHVAGILHGDDFLLGGEPPGKFLAVEPELALGKDVALFKGKMDGSGDHKGLLVSGHGPFHFKGVAVALPEALKVGGRDDRTLCAGGVIGYGDEGEGGLHLETLVAVLRLEPGDLGRGQKVILVHGNIVHGNDAEGFLGLELGVVVAVDPDLALGEHVIFPGKVDPSALHDHLVGGLPLAGGGEVDHLLQVLGGTAQQQAEPAGDAPEVPDVHHRRGKLDMAHALTADPVVGDFHAAPIADDALELGAAALVFSAGALVALCGAEDALAEEPVLFRPEGPVIDGLGLLHLSAGEFPYSFRACELDPHPEYFPSGHQSSSPSSMDIPSGSSSPKSISSGTISSISSSPNTESLFSFSSGSFSSKTGRSLGPEYRPTGGSSSSSSMSSSPIWPSLYFTSTSRPSPWSSLTRTLKLSGTPGLVRFCPLTIRS
ncbi:hypothetical protein SDC9_45271 [bioreactor metagenome]|uniref:Uncharacterized protein n=1 Tax=bioreactor metagenome TaxID=1076179 RepID=A0A644W6C2_9ZZZZ